MKVPAHIQQAFQPSFPSVQDGAKLIVDPIFRNANDKAKHEHQLALEHLYDKNQTLRRIRKEFTDCKSFNFKAFFEKAEIPEAFAFDAMVQMALHRRTSVSTMVGILRRHYEPASDACQQAADMLKKMVDVGLIEWLPNREQLVVVASIDEDVQRDLDRYQYPMPMVVKPLPVRNNLQLGYLATKGSIILRNNHHDEDVCLDHINRLNRIRFSIDFDTARMIANRWRHLDKPKAGETENDYRKRVKAFEKYDRNSRQVIDQMLSLGNEFYLTHRYDKRGRSYCQGYHINYQGTPWNKAVIELADKEYVE